MDKRGALILMYASLAGFGLSAAIHLLSLLRIAIPLPESAMFSLHIGAIVVFAPAVFVVRPKGKRPGLGDILRLCPLWTGVVLLFLLGYAIANSAIFIFATPHGEVETLRLFSGHWMPFYFAAFAVHRATNRVPPGDSKDQPWWNRPFGTVLFGDD